MQVKKLLQNISIRYIKGVGPKKAHLFERLGIENATDLFYYLPRRYEDRSHVIKIKDLKPGQTGTIIGKVLKTNIFTARTGTRIFEIVVAEGNHRVFAVWYNQPFMAKVFSQGQTVMLYGKYEVERHFQITHPTFEILDNENNKESLNIGRIVPVYSLTENLTQKYLRKVVYQAIRTQIGNVQDMLPTRIRAKKRLVDSRFAIENIHFPYSSENLERAYRRLVFEEFFILQAVMAIRRKNIRVMGIKHKVAEGLLSEFERLFTFNFTGEQKKCIKEIEADMSSDKPMYRLLQGDVGSGKTVVSMYALLLSVQNGYQAVMLVPTEILARQHYVTVSKIFMPLGLNVRLLVKGIGQEDRAAIKKELAEGEADIVIGTHSLLQQDIDYRRLGLVVIDEQHKFGVDQRKVLRKKGRNVPDTLIMTATPIPRSLVLTVFGDMDISLLKEKPEGRQPVTTYWIEEDQREAVYAFLRDEITKGHQAFIVYPRIKASDSFDLKSIDRMYDYLQKEVFSDLRIALVHGQLKPGQTKKTMDDFRRKKYDILVATTVIEVGVDIPNVTVMMVEHAERYGLAQLHQLRGRIGRSRHTSFCILMGQPKTDASYQRLSTMTETDDGFEISEKDMDIRGPGEFLGTRQSGLPELKIGNIARDFRVMEEARIEAFSLVEEDPGLKDPRNAGIRQSIVERFKGKLGI